MPIRVKKRLHSLGGHFRYQIIPYWPILIVLGGGCLIYFLITNAGTEGASEGFAAVESAVPVPLVERESTYLKALRLTGDRKLAMMRRLAPLKGDVGNGYAKAHLWMANDLSVDDASAAIGEHLERATTLDPELEEAHESLALHYHVLQKPKEAIRLLEETVQRFPDLRLLLAGLYEETGQIAVAKEHGRLASLHHRELALSDPSDSQHRLRWASAETLQENDETALAIVAHGEALHPAEEAFPKHRLEIHLRQFQRILNEEPLDISEAFAQLEVLLALDPENPRVIAKIGLMSESGEARVRARELLIRLAENESTPALTHKLLGDMAALDADWTVALASYEQALERQPGLSPARNNLAWCLSNLNPPQLDRALIMVDEAIAIAKRQAPDQIQPNYLETRGQILVKLGHYKEAVIPLEQALRFMPETLQRDVHSALAEAYREIGNESLADTHHRLAESETDQGYEVH